jgi:hypothetical protein
MRDTSVIRSRNNKVILITGIFILALSTIPSFMGSTKAPIIIDLGESIYDVANGLSGFEEQYTIGDDWLKLVCTPQSAWVDTLRGKQKGYYAVRFKDDKAIRISWYDLDHVLVKDELLRVHCAVP